MLSLRFPISVSIQQGLDASTDVFNHQAHEHYRNEENESRLDVIIFNEVLQRSKGQY